MMKRNYINIKNLALGLMGAMALSSCKKDAFVESNTDPNVLYSITPEEQFLNATISTFDERFEWYYDYYRAMMPWMQQLTGQNGNSTVFTTEIGNFNTRYRDFYGTYGREYNDVAHLISLMPEEEQAKRQYQLAIAKIPLIYGAFYVSDCNGSLVYTEAFQGIYGGTLIPGYNTQQELYGLFDQQLKEAIATLNNTGLTGQKSFESSDLVFAGDVQSWVKAATSLRLRIAMRLLERDASTAKAIITEVIASGNLINSNDENWTFITSANHSEHGDWDANLFRAPKPTVDFMWDHKDPRIRLYYKMNDYSQDTFMLAKAQDPELAGKMWNPRRYVGSVTSPDKVEEAMFERLYQFRTVDVAGTEVDLDTLSFLQARLFEPSFDSGDGRHYFPVITYADVCFMRAELAVRGITSENAEDWYNKGVRASIKYYDEMAAAAKIRDYMPVTDAEIDTYMAVPEIKYNAATGLEQIVVQAYLNFFKQANEAWAIWKRTGMPNPGTILPMPDMKAEGDVLEIPRRAPFPEANPTERNYENKKAAVEAMMQVEGAGDSPNDVYGRVWWDMP